MPHTFHPHLQKRLTRQERMVSVFVVFAVLVFLLAAGLFVRQIAIRKGWFEVRAPYFTFVESAEGIHVGDKIKLMGSDVGEITEIEPMPPFAPWNVFVAFTIRDPHVGYVWSDSRARIAAGDLLGNRNIELTKGAIEGIPTYLPHEVIDEPISNAIYFPEPHNWKFAMESVSDNPDEPLTRLYETMTRPVLKQLQRLGTNTVRLFNTDDIHSNLMAIYDDKAGQYIPFNEKSKGYFILPDEAPALTDRLETIMSQIEQGLPHILNLTNDVRSLIQGATNLTRQSIDFLAETRVIATNLAAITGQLRDPDGSLGRWLLPTDLKKDVTSTLATTRDSLEVAQSTARIAETNMTLITQELMISLENISQLTSNLNAQVQANAYILGDISDLVRNTDVMMQGLRRHWLLKGAFKEKPHNESVNALEPRLAPTP